MAAVIATAVGVSAGAVVTSAYAVWRLRSEVDSLSRQVIATRSSVAALAATLAASDPPIPGPADEPVALITTISADAEREPPGSRIATITLARPLVTVAAFSSGLRRALNEDTRMRIGYEMRRELKRQRKLRRRQSARRAPSGGWGS